MGIVVLEVTVFLAGRCGSAGDAVEVIPAAVLEDEAAALPHGPRTVRRVHDAAKLTVPVVSHASPASVATISSPVHDVEVSSVSSAGRVEGCQVASR